MLKTTSAHNLMELPYKRQPRQGGLTRRNHMGLCFVAILSSCILFALFYDPAPLHAATPFPRYPVLEKNIRFWEDIYSRYSTSQAVVHDADDLSVVYEVLPIFNYRVPGSAKVNKPLFKGIKNKYSQILKQLARGIPPRSRDEKRVAAFYKEAGSRRLHEAADSVRIQIGQKDRFTEGVIRSGAYMSAIKKIFREEGLPQELAYLPHVESSFNLKAHSKRGASGIWQFTRPTGKQFLTINYAVDERQDPILASHAAARFLKSNYQLLGSWPLALTAYNYGPAGMLRAKKAHGSYENIFRHYQQGYFKFASRNFYSEFLAAISVARKLEKSPSLTLRRPEKTIQFTLPAFMAIGDLCSHFRVNSHTVRKLNPALREPVFQRKKYIPKGYTLHLPDDSRQRKLLADIPRHIYHKRQKPTKFYRVRQGDTAGKIARKHGVSLKALKKANGLDRSSVILIGQNLRIPDSSTSRKKASQIIASIHKVVPEKEMPVKVINPSQDSMVLLADNKKSRPSWENIQQARSMVLGELGVRNITKTANTLQGKIIIQPGESMELLADWLDIPPTRIRRLNDFPKGRLLHTDEEIRIPLSQVSTQAFETRRFEYHLETEEDFFSNYEIVGVRTYIVQQGDTLWKICRTKFDLPFWLLKKYNTNLNLNGLRSSQQLTIPIVKTI